MNRRRGPTKATFNHCQSSHLLKHKLTENFRLTLIPEVQTFEIWTLYRNFVVVMAKWKRHLWLKLFMLSYTTYYNAFWNFCSIKHIYFYRSLNFIRLTADNMVYFTDVSNQVHINQATSSLSCYSELVWLSFFCGTQKETCRPDWQPQFPFTFIDFFFPIHWKWLVLSSLFVFHRN